ncbi:MAG: AmmeMemoRadiSam system radical SAM enzyme [Proteobacteria bacterium]|nr:AmmeMemoRadiSam system radical SAM enzyme [Pseudomonadota bacterium]
MKSAVRSGIILGGAGMVSRAGPVFGKMKQPAGGGVAPPAQTLEELIRQAPQARFWISADTEGGDCRQCHGPDDEVDQADLPHDGRIVKCLMCPHRCVLGEGERGRCRGRINAGGVLKTLVYGRPISVHVDPIEKKPFYHFRPGSEAFSMATSGCPLRCRFCQNWEISQARPEDYAVRYVPPEAVALTAKKYRVPIIAYTYNEPTVFTEYLTDIARQAKEHGISSVLVSCGYTNEAPLAEICSVHDAVKIDLKGFSQEFYRNVCSADLKPVLRSIKQVAQSGIHLEIVNLVVPTLNDSVPMLTELAKWVVGEVGPDVPVHFTRFHPDYQMLNLPPTPVATLERAYEIAKKAGMRYPFVGNVPGHEGNHTYCPSCGKTVIQRIGFFLGRQRLKNGRCGYCSTPIAGVWS